MSQLYDKQINSWFDQAATGLPSEGLAHLFGDTLKSFTKRASKRLNTVTIMAIFKSVLQNCSEQYPVLAKLKVDSTGITAEQFYNQFNQVNPHELSEAFKFLINELVTILSDMTADILQTNVEEQKTSIVDKKSERIDYLYEISKVFAGFDNVEKSFAEIFMILGSSFSFQTILLIEKKGSVCISTVWHNTNTDERQLERAFNYSRRSYEYLVCPLSHHENETFETIIKHAMPVCSLKTEVEDDKQWQNKFITMPLTLSSLQTFGVLQFESINPLNEDDLKFISALTNLIAVALDRFNKENEADKMIKIELTKRLHELSTAQNYVRDLELERDMREQFVSILTHDLRTPLTSAKMSAQLILKRPENIEKNIFLANKVIFSVDRMDRMIKDLLDANRIRAGESLTMNMNSCDMRSIVASTLKDLSVAYGDRFLMQVDRDIENGFWNEDGIRRVIENLANNAVKYGKPNELITVKISQSKDSVQLSVHNSGNPIPVEDQSNLFQPFHRTRSASSGEKKGWGLGLTLVRGVAEAHGGTVTVQSSDKEGTIFVVTIPKDSRPFQTNT